MKATVAVTIIARIVTVSARVLWVPAEFDPSERTGLIARDGSTPCGPAFPSDFTCSSTTQCMALNSTSSIQAVICCPTGQDCKKINPVNCDQSLQNATLAPNSELHSSPTVELQTCGTACCPVGYSCLNGICQANSAPVPATSMSAAPTSASTPASSTIGATAATSPTQLASTAASSASAAADSNPAETTSTSPATSATAVPTGAVAEGISASGSPAKSFSGASFAAGFVPGIALGAIAAAYLLLFWLRRRANNSYVEAGDPHRDTLTTLGPLSRRPTMHGRSISEPMPSDPPMAERTDFARSTPERVGKEGVVPDGIGSNFGYSAHVYASPASGPMSPARTPRAVKALFARRSMFRGPENTPPIVQEPLPAHMKRGTLGYYFNSPVKPLKTKKSMQSLRRHATDASRACSRMSRSGSQETIQVLMPSREPYTPDQRPQIPGLEKQMLPVETAHGHSSNTSPAQHYTPTRAPPGGDSGGMLGTPYSPSKFHGNATATQVADRLGPPKKAERPVTTISNLLLEFEDQKWDRGLKRQPW